MGERISRRNLVGAVAAFIKVHPLWTRAIQETSVNQPALAIPVLEIELNGDGSVRRIQVLRRPGQAADTVQLAMAAVQRADFAKWAGPVQKSGFKAD